MVKRKRTYTKKVVKKGGKVTKTRPTKVMAIPGITDIVRCVEILGKAETALNKSLNARKAVKLRGIAMKYRIDINAILHMHEKLVAAAEMVKKAVETIVVIEDIKDDSDMRKHYKEAALRANKLREKESQTASKRAPKATTGTKRK